MRINYLIIVAAISVFVACTREDQSSSDTWFTEMEQALAESPTDEAVSNYLETLDSLIDSDVTNIERNAALLQRASALQFNLNKIQSSIELMGRSLRMNPDAKEMKEHLMKYVQLNNRMNNDPELDSLQQVLIQASFDENGDRLTDASLEAYLEAINATRNNIYSNSSNPNFRDAKRYVHLVEFLALTHPNLDQLPNMMYEAGKVADLIKNPRQSVMLFEWCYQKYPEADIAPENLFMLAFTCQESLKNESKAITYYKLFLEKYPDHEMYGSAEFLLQNINKSDEEILEELRNKN